MIVLTTASLCRVSRVAFAAGDYRSMRRATLRILFALAMCDPSCLTCSATDELPGWASVPAVLARINEPRFASRDFIITSYGGIADGKADCKAAFDKAIAACTAAGGGRVVVPAGDWFVRGPL